MRATHWKIIAVAVFVSILTQKQFGYGPMIAALVGCLVLAWLQKRKMKELGGNENGCEQSAEFQTPLDPDQAVGKVKDYFKTVKAKIVLEDPSIALLIATVPISWKTFGERVFVAIEKEATGGVYIYVKSTPRFTLTLFDWGKNLGHVLAIKKVLS